MVERYRYHYLTQDQELTLFAGAREMLDELSQAGYFLAVATGKSRVGLNRALDAVHLLSRVRRHALCRRNFFQAASGDAAGTDARTRPGHEAHRDDRRHHA